MQHPTGGERNFYINAIPSGDLISLSAKKYIYGLNKTGKKLELKIIFILSAADCKVH